MIFPSEILPNKEYKIIDCSVDCCHLARTYKSIADLPIINPLTGSIQLKYVAEPTKHIADYSTNLMGIFELQHLLISLTTDGKNKFSQECAPDENVETPVFNEDFIVADDINYFSILVSDLDNVKVDYSFGDDKLIGICRIEHTPMRWNFWHFSIRWVNHNGDYLHQVKDNKLDSGWARRLCSAAKAIVVQYAKLTDPPYFIIPKTCYCK